MNPLVKRMLYQANESREPKYWSTMGAHLPVLYTLARQAEGAIVECGVSWGFSTLALLSAALERQVLLTSYDIKNDCRARAMSTMGLKEEDLPAGYWKFVLKDSVRAAQDWKDESVGLWFLDTTHKLKDTRRELHAWLPKMRPDGIMCGHDYLLHLDAGFENARVKAAVDEFVARYSNRFELLVFPHDRGFFIMFPK
jgi:predicted O-methyltransferase YrrM